MDAHGTRGHVAGNVEVTHQQFAPPDGGSDKCLARTPDGGSDKCLARTPDGGSDKCLARTPDGGSDKYFVRTTSPLDWTHSTPTPQVTYHRSFHDAVHKSLPGVLPDPNAPNGQLTNGKILGLRRRTFFIALAVVTFVVVGAVVGGTVGWILGRKSSSGTPSSTSSSASSSTSSSTSPPPTPSIGSPVLSNSSIAAINYNVTEGGASYRMVFWQHNSSALMFSLWDSANATWEVTNVTENLIDTSVRTQPLLGTPLAAAVRGYPWTEKIYYDVPFGIALFYLTPDNIILELYSTDPRGGSWQLGDMTTSDIQWVAGNGLQLAALWQLCDSALCSGDIALFYEATNQGIQLGNSSDWSAGPLGIISNVEAASGFAVITITGSQGSAASSVRLYYDSFGELQEMLWEEGQDAWSNGVKVGSTLPNNPPSVAAMAFATATNASAGPREVMVVPRFDNGSLVVNYWDNTKWNYGYEPIIQGKVYTNFTAVALLADQDLKFFGITNDLEIQAFTIDRTLPLSWTYDSAVAMS